MAQESFVNIELLLKQIQDEEVTPQFQQEALFVNEFADKKPGKKTNQKGYEIISSFTPDPSKAYISAGGAMPAGGSIERAAMYVGYVRYRQTIEMDNDTYRDLTRGDGNTLIDFGFRVREATEAGIREIEEACFGNGKGIKAVVGSSSSTSSIVLTTTPTSTPYTSKGAEFLYKNHAYDLYDASDALREANIYASAVTKGSSPTLTPASTLTVTPASTDVLVLAGSFNKVHRGLDYLTANGSGMKQGLSMSTYDELKTPTEDLAGANLQPLHVLRLKNKIKFRGGKQAGKNLKIIGSSQLEANDRVGFNFLQLNVGQKWDGVVDGSNMGGVTPMWVSTCDDDRLYFINADDFGKIENQSWGFLKDADGRMGRQKAGSNGVGSDAVYFNLGWDGNFYVKHPNAHGRIIRGSVSGLATSATARD